MILNETFYKGKDNYSDVNVENTIIKYIKSGKSVDEILKKDSSWPVYYHLASNRQNIVNWYPFKKNASILEIGAGMGAITSYLCSVAKKVVSVESSKRRASAIAERCKKCNDLEIVVGNFNDIEFNEKFDYITLIGVYEYALMFTDNKENAYVELLEKVKKLLKPNGKILIAIENRFGLKYWCGAKEDHTKKIFDGINNYSSDNQFVRTFSKADLEEIFKTVGLYSNFYYPLPDYKFPEFILTDEIVGDNNVTYAPYYSILSSVFINERKLFKDILANNVLSFFANSYFIELGLMESKKDVLYAKFNNYRFSKYATITYKKDGNFYKKNIYDEGIKHIYNIINYSKVLNNLSVNSLPVYKSDEICYTKQIDNNYSLMDKLVDLYFDDRYDLIIEEIDQYYDYLKKHFKVINPEHTIFDDFKIKLHNCSKLSFVEDGFIDLCFQNIILNQKDYLVIDQEWYFKNVPLEYILYRSLWMLTHTTNIDDGEVLYKKLLKNYGLDSYEECFNSLEKALLSSIINYSGEYECLVKFNNNYIPFRNYIDDAIDCYQIRLNEIAEYNMRIQEQNTIISDIKKKNHDMEEDCILLNQKVKNLEDELSNIYKSKGYKLLQKFYAVKNHNMNKKK